MPPSERSPFLSCLVSDYPSPRFFCLPDIIHKFTRDKYSKRFPELESLVPDSLDYIRTVKVRVEEDFLSTAKKRKFWIDSSRRIILRMAAVRTNICSSLCPCAQELGNNLEKCKNNETLQQILTNATIMVVSVTASTTQG